VPWTSQDDAAFSEFMEDYAIAEPALERAVRVDDRQEQCERRLERIEELLSAALVKSRKKVKK